MKRQPFEEGWDAGLRGYRDPRVICPYSKMTREWREWHAFYGRAVELRAALSGVNVSEAPVRKLCAWLFCIGHSIVCGGKPKVTEGDLMSRTYGTRNNYPEGYAEYEGEMDWRKQRDAALFDENQELANLSALNTNLFERIETVTARAELAEHALIDTVSARRARIYAALFLVFGVFIGYFVRLVTA